VNAEEKKRLVAHREMVKVTLARIYCRRKVDVGIA
jgi:hypothetical protein